MTSRRFDVLAEIRKNPRASIRELCEATGIKSPSNIWYHLHMLEQEGVIIRDHGARGIHVTGIVHALKADAKRRQRELARKRNQRRKSPLSLEERINAIVEKALSHERTADEISGVVDPIRENRSAWGAKAWKIA